MQHRRKQRGLILYSTRLTESRDQRLGFRKRDRWLNRTFRLFDDLRRKLTRIAKPNVTRIKIFWTETRCFTQCSTDNAATDIRRTIICRRKLMARKIPCSTCQIHV